MEQETKTAVEMTAREAAEFAAFRKEQELKAAAAKVKADREAYDTLVDETIDEAMPVLQGISSGIAEAKKAVMGKFRLALEIKSSLYGVKEGQRTHTFTNSKGTCRITLGYHHVDDYRDTVDEGIAMVKEAIESLGKDDESRALVGAVLRLLARDQRGTLKASRVLQLQKLAVDSKNDRFIEGVNIIRESYQPAVSKQFIRAEVKGDGEEWRSIPLGMTEA